MTTLAGAGERGMRPVQYLFRGLRRETGEPVEGRITAPSEDVAHNVLGELGIVVVSLQPEPVTRADRAAAAGALLFDPALEAALDEAGLRIRFDQLARRYEGRSVWVLDRERISARVMQLVNEAIGHDAGRYRTQHHIAQMLETMFDKPHVPGAEQAAGSVALVGEVGRLAAAVGKIQRTMASMSVTARREPRFAARPAASDRTRDEVLAEVFRSNLELRGAIDGPAPLPLARTASVRTSP